MTWLQGRSMFGAAPLYCGDRSTIARGISGEQEESMVGDRQCVYPVISTQKGPNGAGVRCKKKKDKLTFPKVSYSPL